MERLKILLLIGLPLYGISIAVIPNVLELPYRQIIVWLDPAMLIFLFLTFPLKLNQGDILNNFIAILLIIISHLIFWCPIALLIYKIFKNKKAVNS